MSNDKINSSKKNTKKKKNSTSLNKFLKVIILILLLIIFIGASLALGTAYAWIRAAKPIDYGAIFDLNQTTYIVDENDKLIDKLHSNEKRTMVSLREIPLTLQNAFVAIEDKRFNKHNGIDPYRILGAIRADIKKGDLAQGGSTITQQLIKNIYLTPDKKFKRKVVEMYYAIQLERRYTKEQILEAYLNRVDFSNNISGVKEASHFYFGKELMELNLAECAMLAGITNNPSRYAPNLNFGSSTKRKELILNEMLNQKMISTEEYDDAINYQIVLSRLESEFETSYFIDLIIRDVTEALVKQLGYQEAEAKRKLFNGGLKVVTTIDIEMQNFLEGTFKDDKLFPPSVETSGQTITPEAAFVLLENDTGKIKAIMGGRSETTKRGWNRAIQAVRQPGSSIKPLSAYAPALDNGYTVGTVIDDAAVSIGKYSPKNYSRKYKGLVTVREAIQSSINTVATKIVQDIGLMRSIDYLKRFGFTSIVESDKDLAPLALGGLTNGVKPIEMAAAYTVFPNKGILIKPISFVKILDKDNNIILENKPIMEKVISPQVAYLMIDIMKGVVKSGGTATRAALSKIPVAGKTGTTSDSKDAWFVGYSPYYTAAVWMGFDEPRKIVDKSGRSVTGGSFPAEVWRVVMEEVHKNLAYKDFEKPSGLVTVDICTKSGKKPSELCALDPRGSTIKSEIFVKGTEPGLEDICDVHALRDIDTSTNLIASPYCPVHLIQSKVFIQRLFPYVPIAGEPDPDDIIFEVPINTCTMHTDPFPSENTDAEGAANNPPADTPTVTPSSGDNEEE